MIKKQSWPMANFKAVFQLVHVGNMEI